MWRAPSTVSVNHVIIKARMELAIKTQAHTHCSLNFYRPYEFAMVKLLLRVLVFLLSGPFHSTFWKVHLTFSCIRLNVQLHHMTCLTWTIQA